MVRAIGCRSCAGLLCHDAVLQAVIQFCAAVNGNGRPANGVDGCDEVYSRFFHQPDSNKEMLRD
jgi:hypothetical protein